MKLRSLLLAATASFAILALGGCAKQTAAEIQSGVAKAQAAGDKNVADVQRVASDRLDTAQAEVNDARKDLAHEDALGTRRVTVAEAEAAHKVSLERCMAHAGDEKTRCQSQADADFVAAKANADATKVATDPKG